MLSYSAASVGTVAGDAARGARRDHRLKQLAKLCRLRLQVHALVLGPQMASSSAFEWAAGSDALAAATQRERWTAQCPTVHHAEGVIDVHVCGH
jgi:hypothetical protein